MLEDVLLRREDFPIDILDSNGNPVGNSKIEVIPFIHPYFLEGGIDLDLLTDDVIDEIEQNTNLDREECQTRPYLNYEARQIRLGWVDRGENYVRFPSFMEGLCIEKFQITPFGPVNEDGGIYIETLSNKHRYKIPTDRAFSKQLVDEYRINLIREGGENYVEVQRGWASHNLDSRDILIKNVLISLNNAHVRKKCSNL